MTEKLHPVMNNLLDFAEYDEQIINDAYRARLIPFNDDFEILRTLYYFDTECFADTDTFNAYIAPLSDKFSDLAVIILFNLNTRDFSLATDLTDPDAVLHPNYTHVKIDELLKILSQHFA